ncbi:MAG: FAD-dependent oxidoreductase [Patescibacteria group bacterium]
MTDDKKIFDVIIIGGGAAGLTAGIYSSRRALKTLLISPDIGGQAASTDEIENYPGVELITGPELMDKFKKQAEKFGTEFVFAEVTKIESKQDKENKPLFTISTNTENYTSYSVILAFGLTHRHLNVPGEKEFGAKGVGYCATCDAPLFKNKPVMVVGGGNSAIDAALLLAKNSPKVYLVNRNDNFNAEAVLVEQLKQPQIEVIMNSQVKEIKGDTRVKSVVIYDNRDPNKTREIITEGVFVQVGFVVDAKLVEGLVDLDERKQIKISWDAETSAPGIFAAGDLTAISYKQIVISAGWGATAALKAYEYLQKVRGLRGVKIDWGRAGK